MPESHLSELYHVLSPEGPLGVTPLPAAPRLDTLTGKKIAFVWDYAFRGDEMFPVIEDGLRETFGAVDFVGPGCFRQHLWRRRGSGAGRPAGETERPWR